MGKSGNDDDKKKKGWDAIDNGKGLMVDYRRVKHAMLIRYILNLMSMLRYWLFSSSSSSSSFSLS